MLNSTAHRTPMAALMALPIAYGLFLLMSTLIEVNEITLAEPATRILGMITPQLPETNDEIRKRPKPQMLDAATKPPPPPALSTTQADIHLPVPVTGGAAPGSLLPIRLNLPAISPVVVSSRGYQVIRPPMPVYPRPFGIVQCRLRHRYARQAVQRVGSLHRSGIQERGRAVCPEGRVCAAACRRAVRERERPGISAGIQAGGLDILSRGRPAMSQKRQTASRADHAFEHGNQNQRLAR